jgi:protein-tyrosine phosphatase
MKILFVCLGNICRSPTAEGVFRKYLADSALADKVSVESAGTADWHTGKGPDPRTCEAALKRGYDLSKLQARQATAEDFHNFDLILAMDKSNLANLEALRPANSRAELDLLLQRYDLPRSEVPDPYYGGEQGFEDVLDLLENASQALLAELQERV